jgi:RNA polymerase sigma-70 factor (ECF subfamily)
MHPFIELTAEIDQEGRLAALCSHPLDRLSDEQLMALISLNQSPLAFDELYDRHAGGAFASALRICADRALAEDAVQEAFLSLWRARGRFDRRRGNVRGWVLTIVRNKAIDVLRRGAGDRAELVEHALERLEAVQRTEEEVDGRERASALRCALEGLPAEQSSVIELSYYGGYTQTEIAAMFDAPVGTIKGRIRLGLEKLRADLLADRALA